MRETMKFKNIFLMVCIFFMGFAYSNGISSYDPISNEPRSYELIPNEPSSSEPISNEPSSSEPISNEPSSSEPISYESYYSNETEFRKTSLVNSIFRIIIKSNVENNERKFRWNNFLHWR